MFKNLIDRFNQSDREPATDPVPGLTLYHFSTCPFCVRVRAAASRLGVTLDQRNIRRDPEAYTELLEGGGSKQVPCLRIAADNGDPERWLYESGDIVQYLETRFASQAG